MRTDLELDGTVWGVLGTIDTSIGRLASLVFQGEDDERLRVRLLMVLSPHANSIASSAPLGLLPEEMLPLANLIGQAGDELEKLPPRDPSDPLALLAAAGDLTVSHLGLGEEGMVLVHRPNPEQRLLLPGVDLPALANLLRESYHRLNEHMDFLKTPVAAVTN